MVGNPKYLFISPGEDFSLSVAFKPNTVEKLCSKLLLKVNNDRQVFSVSLEMQLALAHWLIFKKLPGEIEWIRRDLSSRSNKSR